MMAGMMAGLTSLLAVVCIYWSWRKPGQVVVASTGWLLALGSAIVWSIAFGPEFGVTYAIIAFMCLTWLAVLIGTDSSRTATTGTEAGNGESRAVVRPYRRLAGPSTADMLRHGTLFLLSVPATGVLTLILSVAMVLYLPWTMLNKIAVAIFLWPVLWGALSAWISAQEKIMRPTVVVIALLFIGSLALFI